MRIIIAGGTGFIGSALARSFAADGHEVIVLSRNPQSARGLPTGVRVVAWDAKTANGWGELADGADAIINLAGESLKGNGLLPSRWSKKRKHAIFQSRVDAGTAVVQAIQATRRKPAMLLQSSAVGYYGPCGDEIVTEQAPAGRDFLSDVCTAWEASTADVEAMGVRRAVARVGLPLANDGGAFPLLKLPFQFFAGNVFGSGRQYYPWIHFDDTIAALRLLVESPEAKGAFNISAPHPETNRDFARTLGRVMRRPVWLPAPRFAVQAALGELATVVLDGQRAVPTALEKLGVKFRHPHLEGALNDLLSK
jgi:uncharacterized protein (TIGR01777 family)